jgi:hypothetical protein
MSEAAGREGKGTPHAFPLASKRIPAPWGTSLTTRNNSPAVLLQGLAEGALLVRQLALVQPASFLQLGEHRLGGLAVKEVLGPQ